VLKPITRAEQTLLVDCFFLAAACGDFELDGAPWLVML
jgi:hypothetical protein